MKRISLVCLLVALCGAPLSRAQDAATEERLNKLKGDIESIIESQQVLNKKLDQLTRELEAVREQAAQPKGNFASQDRVDAIAKAVAEVDKKRMQDADKIKTELENIRKGLLQATPPSPSAKKKANPVADAPPEKDQQGFEYTLKAHDTLSTIVQAYREQKVKVTVDQILKANPGLKADRLIVGKTIFIPAPKQ
jgi:septal ring factor EnvC (AmiA/AmiB activator)